jgi:hypothetical protein
LIIKKGVPLIVNIKVESIVDEISFSRIIAKLAHHSRLIMIMRKIASHPLSLNAVS